eukprot:7066254-Lingulodinium_polyedra.AAC.1
MSPNTAGRKLTGELENTFQVAGIDVDVLHEVAPQSQLLLKSGEPRVRGQGLLAPVDLDVVATNAQRALLPCGNMNLGLRDCS